MCRIMSNNTGPLRDGRQRIVVLVSPLARKLRCCFKEIGPWQDVLLAYARAGAQHKTLAMALLLLR